MFLLTLFQRTNFISMFLITHRKSCTKNSITLYSNAAHVHQSAETRARTLTQFLPTLVRSLLHRNQLTLKIVPIRTSRSYIRLIYISSSTPTSHLPELGCDHDLEIRTKNSIHLYSIGIHLNSSDRFRQV